MSTTRLGPQDFKAMGVIANARKNNLKTMFEGTHLTFAKYAREKSVKNALSDASSLASSTKSLEQSPGSREEILRKLREGPVERRRIRVVIFAPGLLGQGDQRMFSSKVAASS